MIPNILPEDLKDHEHSMRESLFADPQILSRDSVSVILVSSALCDQKSTVRHHMACTRFKLKVFDIN